MNKVFLAIQNPATDVNTLYLVSGCRPREEDGPGGGGVSVLVLVCGLYLLNLSFPYATLSESKGIYIDTTLTDTKECANCSSPRRGTVCAVCSCISPCCIDTNALSLGRSGGSGESLLGCIKRFYFDHTTSYTDTNTALRHRARRADSTPRREDGWASVLVFLQDISQR